MFSYPTAKAVEHLGLLTKLQNLSLGLTQSRLTPDICPGLQELKALTRLKLSCRDIPAVVYQLTALQHLDVLRATPTALNKLQALTSLTQLHVQRPQGFSFDTPPLQLPGLQHLVLNGWRASMPVSF